MVNLIGALPETASVLCQEARLHLYDKAPRPGRKIGHITLLAEDHASLAQKLAALQPLLPWESLLLAGAPEEKTN
jgi:5-(carboxyamino)imidazole ribonucleotide synthase